MADETRPEPGVIERGWVRDPHEAYETADVVRVLREIADFVEAGHGGIQKYMRMHQEMLYGVRRWVLHLTYLDKRKRER